jgi:hypothetical protein
VGSPVGGRYQGGYSPYYTENHKKFRAVVRAFVEKEIKPHVDEWIVTGYPKDLHVKVAIPCVGLFAA